jgi:hypothetical protein
MASSILKTVAVLAGLVTSLGAYGPAAAASPSKVLVLEGKVVEIGQIDHEQTAWLVTVKVEKVTTGEFSEPTFSFAIHSPAMSGLEKGRSYTVTAVWKNGGYVVDPLQWRRGKRIRSRIVTPEPATKALQRTIAFPRFARAGVRC